MVKKQADLTTFQTSAPSPYDVPPHGVSDPPTSFSASVTRYLIFPPPYQWLHKDPPPLPPQKYPAQEPPSGLSPDTAVWVAHYDHAKEQRAHLESDFRNDPNAKVCYAHTYRSHPSREDAEA